MANDPKLISKGGPVFEFGPGWGIKVKTWLGKYSSKYILPVIILIFIGYGVISWDWSGHETSLLETPGVENNSWIIAQIVHRGDGATHTARRVITEYLAAHPEVIVTAGQKVFLENILSKKINGKMMFVGNKIEFTGDEIKSGIEQSRQLTPTQLQKWEIYATRAGVK